MFPRDSISDAASTVSSTSTGQPSDSFSSTSASQTDTRSDENVFTPPPASVYTTSRPDPSITLSSIPIPSSTDREHVVVETSTPPEPHSFSTPVPSTSATLSDTPGASTSQDSHSTPTAEGSTSADAHSSTTLIYSIITIADPTSTATPASSSLPSMTSPSSPSVTFAYSILPVLDSTTFSTPTSSPSQSSTSIYSVLPVSDSTTLPASILLPGSQSSTFIHSILSVSEYTPSTILSELPTLAYSISPVLDSASTIILSESPTLAYSFLPVSDSTPTTIPSGSSTLAYSILPVSDPSTPTIVPVSTTTTLVYPILPVSVSTTTAVISSTPTIWPPHIISSSPVTTTATAAKDLYQDSATVPGDRVSLSKNLSSETAPTLSPSASEVSSQRINNLALQPTTDPVVDSLPVTVVTSGSITRTFVVHATDGITGVGGVPGAGEGRGVSSGDTGHGSHTHIIPIILGSIFGCVLVVTLFLFAAYRRKRLQRWHRLPEPSFRDVYEPALDTSRHSSRFLNPFTDIDDDWSIIAPERTGSATTTASTLAFAPSMDVHGDGDDVGPSGHYTPWETPTLSFFARARSGGWLSTPR